MKTLASFVGYTGPMTTSFMLKNTTVTEMNITHVLLVVSGDVIPNMNVIGYGIDNLFYPAG